ncbi:MAG: tRNA preQ1(34) S-adenosylmethionine ribosyltransferase-isomerase QueA [Planctomycetes bacterium]|nr:tRNA preQ1(34) S-adenosylmethionine ribosyltransferase-isomerase QueA [Planctomycetota bacterium]
MQITELDYDLPPELIAQRPAETRSASRLLVLNRTTGALSHRHFNDVAEYVRAGDCLVLNDTRVIPARFFCRRATGGRIEGLFLREQDGLWRTLLKPSARLKIGERLSCEGAAAELVISARHERGEWTVQPEPPCTAIELLGRIGQTPLPPYIRRTAPPDAADAERYQTVYARRAGAVAAPTAGLHFTPEVLHRLAAAGIRRADVTLHVGLGTFAAVEVSDLARHPLHAEWFEVTELAARTIREVSQGPGRIVAVGTTSTRVLESLVARANVAGQPPHPAPAGAITAQSGWADLFIYPPYQFGLVDVLLTNFHLPRSTLLALVMAFAGVNNIRRAYRAAIEQRYRFYSYGDAMLIV